MLVNFLSRIQAIDKILAFDEERMLAPFQGGSEAGMMSIFAFERFRNQAADIGVYARWLVERSASLVILGMHPIHRQLMEEALRLGVPARMLEGTEGGDWLGDLPGCVTDAGSTHLVMLRNESHPVAHALRAQVLGKGGTVVRYFKSRHDHGIGISADRRRLSAVQQGYYLTRRAVRWAVRRIQGGREEYWVYDPEALETLTQASVPTSWIRQVSYPLAGDGWLSFVRREATRIGLCAEADLTTVVLFLRGPIHGRPDRPENQIMPSSLLAQLLEEIRDSCASAFGTFRVYIKPHPNQNEESLAQTLSRVDFREATTVSHPPALLCALADVVITTYSSTCLDAKAAGVPVAEYYRETPEFFRRHPKGNRFGFFGIDVLRRPEELTTWLGAVDEKSPRASA